MKRTRFSALFVALFVVLVAVVLVAGVGAQGPAPDAPPIAHVNDRYGFRVDYAAPWSFTGGAESGAGYRAEFAAPDAAGRPGRFFYVVVRNLAPHATLDEWLAAEREVTLREPAITRPVTVDGVTGVEQVFDGPEGTWIARYFLRWDKVYLLNYGPVASEATETPPAFTWDARPRLDAVPTLPPNPFGPPPGDNTDAPTGQPPLQFPFCGTWRISNGYHPNAHPNDQYNYYALDFVATDGATTGKPIYAAHNGTVSTAWDSYGGGWLSKLTYDADAGYKTWYAHLDSFTITSGYAAAGAELGRAGASGVVTGPHLHFALLQNNVSIKPEPMGGQTGFVYNQTHTRNCGGYTCTDVLPVGEGSSRKQLFVDAYYRMGGRAVLGCTLGGAYWWQGPNSQLAIVRQDFGGPSGAGGVMITHDEISDHNYGGVPAYATYGWIYTKYMNLGGINNYSVGVPTSDEYTNAAGEPQANYTWGYITWDGDSVEFFGWPASDTAQWRVRYFNGRTDNFNRWPTWTTNLNTTFVDFNWGEGAPGNGRWGVWSDNFSMATFKQVVFDAGRYNFHIQADDGVKLWIDSTLLINEWQPASGNHYNAEINLTQGSHVVTLAYYEEAGAALVKLDWTKLNPPAAPTISAISNGDGNYPVSWSAVSGATAYVLQENFNGGSWYDIYTGSNTSYNATGRAAGQWCYRVRATNSAGSSGNSAEVCVNVLNLPGTPILIAPPHNAQFNRNDNITLSWNSAANATRYYAEVWGGPSVANGSGWITDTSWPVGQLWGGSYQWRVKSRNAAGVESGWSETRDFTVKLGSPSNLTAAAVSGAQVNLAWSASADAAILDGYRLYRNGAHVATVAATATSYQDSGLACNTGYTYTLRAYRGATESDVSNAAGATTGVCAGATVFISPSGTGAVGGIAFSGADVLRYERDANRWTMVYDGSAKGTPKNVAAFSLLPDGSLLLVFAANQTIAGLGTATPYDVVRFTPTAPDVFPLGPGAYSWVLQGRSQGLTTSSEKIDAVDWVGSWLMLSTTGAAKLPLPGGATLDAADEDVFVYELNNARWRSPLLIDGSLIPGMTAEDIGGVWDDQNSGDFYVTITGAFTVGAPSVKGNGKSIVKLTPNGGASVYTPSLVGWLATGAVFPSNLDGVDMGGR